MGKFSLAHCLFNNKNPWDTKVKYCKAPAISTFQCRSNDYSSVTGISIFGVLVLTICLAQRSTRWLPAKRQVAGTRVSPLLKSMSGWEWTWLEQDLSKENEDSIHCPGSFWEAWWYTGKWQSKQHEGQHANGGCSHQKHSISLRLVCIAARRCLNFDLLCN